jgi:rhodanese-related sulfurtransferase
LAGGPAPSLPRDREIVVYDSDPNELASSGVAATLIRQGYKAVALQGGINDWLTANLPTETKDAPKQAPPEPGALKG